MEHSDEEKKLLPHLYGWPWYDWAYDFFHSTNRFNFITAANQISKSSTMIRKCIHWATETEIWPELWKTKPTQFWYFYPSKDLATKEFEQKWVKEFLPRDYMKNDPKYGWKEDIRFKQIYSLTFNTGVTVYFMSYEQKLSNLQASSVYAMFCDEEIPKPIYDESYQRISAVEGYFHSVFTATLGQRIWYETMELRGQPGERFKSAFKRQVSKWDCLHYRDGSLSPWTAERIRVDEEACSSEAEKLKRIFGRFVMDENLLFSSFDSSESVVLPDVDEKKSKEEWMYWSGVYIGRSGRASICIVRTNGELDRAEVIASWVSKDDKETALGIFLEYLKLAGDLEFASNHCDMGGIDFIKATRGSKSYFEPHRMPKDRGEKIINSLFKSGILKIHDVPKNKELIMQLMTTLKKNEMLVESEAVGALITAVRPIPWDFSKITNPVKPKKTEKLNERMAFWLGKDRPQQDELTTEQELDYLNEDYQFYGYGEG